MVVRATIDAAVKMVPFSDRLPERVQHLVSGRDARLAALEIAPGEVRPLVTPAQKIRQRMREKRPLTAQASVSLDRCLSADADEDGNETARETDSQSLRQARMELYLAEQHDEFTSLINKNLKEAMRQQQQQQHASPLAEEPGWRRLVVEVVMARTSEDAVRRLGLLAARAGESVYSSMPFVRGERPLSAAAGGCEDAALEAETAAWLGELDYAQKVALLRLLMVDLGMRADADAVASITRGASLEDDTSVAEKLELLALLLVRLGFLGLRCLWPVSRLLYTKFKENDMLLVNNRNFGRLLTVLARTMAAVEERLNAYAAPSRPRSLTLTATTA